MEKAQAGAEASSADSLSFPYWKISPPHSLKLCVRVSCRTRLHQKTEGLSDKTSLPKGINQILILNSQSLRIQECQVNSDMKVQISNCRKPQVSSSSWPLLSTQCHFSGHCSNPCSCNSYWGWSQMQLQEKLSLGLYSTAEVFDGSSGRVRMLWFHSILYFCTILLQVCKTQLEHKLTAWLWFWFKWHKEDVQWKQISFLLFDA